MITRKLFAALVGLSFAAGTLGSTSAQTPAPATTQSVSPSDATAPTIAAKSDTAKKAPVRKHHARMTSKTHRKHVSLRTSKRIAGKHVDVKVAHHASKRVHLSHLVKRGIPKHV